VEDGRRQHYISEGVAEATGLVEKTQKTKNKKRRVGEGKKRGVGGVGGGGGGGERKRGGSSTHVVSL
jgi:hypothetical protein